MAGGDAPTTPDRLKDRLSPTLFEPQERILQSQDRDMQVLLQGVFEKRDETLECAKRTEGAPAPVISYSFEVYPGLP